MKGISNNHGGGRSRRELELVTRGYILANAGGVVVSFFEWVQNLNNDYWEEDKVLEKLKSTMVASFNDVYGICTQENGSMRRAAYQLAVKRILYAERLRGNL